MGYNRFSLPFQLLSAIFICAAFSACSNDGGKQVHAPALSTDASLAKNASVDAASVVNLDERSDSDADVATVLYNQANSISQLTEQLKSVSAVREQEGKLAILEAVAERLLRQELIRPIVGRNNDIVNLFFGFNAELLTAYRFANVKARVQKILAKYEDLIFAGCDSNLKGCLNVEFLTKIGNVKDILLATIDTSGSANCDGLADGVYYKRLRMGYALTNWGVDEPRLDAKYLYCSLEYLANLEGIPNPIKQKLEVEKFLTDVERVIARTDKLAADPKLSLNLNQFKQKLDPNSFVAANLGITPVQKSIQRMRQSFLLANLRTINDPKFVDEIHQGNLKISDPFSYDSILKLFEKEKSPILENLKASVISDRGALFTIVESVVTKRWTPNMGLSFFDKLKKENPELLKQQLENTVKSYAQAMFLKQVVESNAEMGRFYEKNDFQTSEMVQEALEKSQSLQKDWGEFYSRIELLREFTGGSLRLPANKLAQMGLDVKSLVLTSYYMISFPHMMMMAYYMAEKKFEIIIRSFWGMSFKVNYVDVLEWIFEGGMAPWFSYSPGTEMGYDSIFNSYQVMHSLYFALRTETFKVFKVKEEEFLKKTIDTMVYNHSVMYAEGYEVRQQSRNRYLEEYESIKKACVEERKREKAKASGGEYMPQYYAEFDFSKLDDGILYNTRWYQVLLGRENQMNYSMNTLVKSDYIGLNFANYISPERLDIMRLETSRVLRNIDTILEIYRNFLAQKGEGQDSIQKKIDYVSSGLKQLRHNQRRYYTALNTFNTDIVKDCAALIGLRENELYNEMHWKEIEHLRNVYRDKVKIINGEAKYSDVIGKYKFQGYESIGYTGRDDFSGPVYRYTALDSHMRVGKYLEQVAPYIHMQLPSPDGMRKTEVFQKTAKTTDIPFFDADGKLVSEDTFVRTARSFGGDISARATRAHTHWEVSMVMQTLWNFNEYYLPAVATMYRLGEVETFDASNPICLSATPQPESVCPVKKLKLFSADEIMKENLRLAKWVSLKPEEEELYDIENMPAKVMIDLTVAQMGGTGRHTFDPATQGTLFNPSTGGPTGFFDYLFLLSSSPMMAQSLKLPWSMEEEERGPYEPHRFKTSVLLKDYYKSQVWLQFLPFGVDPTTNEKLHVIYRDFYKEDGRYVREILDEVAKLKAEDERSNQKRRLRRSLWEEPYYGPYITTKYLNDYEQGLKDFNRETMGFYQQTKP